MLNNLTADRTRYAKVLVTLLVLGAGLLLAELVGSHNEVGLVLNFVPGKTLDTDRLSADNNGELQLFGWDVWEIFKETTRLYPYSMHQKYDRQLTAINNRMRYIMTRTFLALATFMVLTDGPLKAIMVKKA